MKKIGSFFVRLLFAFFFFLFLWPWFLYRKYGNKKYQLKGKTIIISNHFSDFDIFYIYLLFGFKKHLTFVGYEGVKIGISKILAYAYDVIMVYEDQIKNTKAIHQMVNVLNHDGVLVIFPEGYIDEKKNDLEPFFESYLLVGKLSSSCILPLAIYPENQFLKPSKIYIGDVISPLLIENYPREELNHDIRQYIYDHLKQIGVKMKE